MLVTGSSGAAGGAADLDGLELLAAADAAANIEDHFLDGGAHGNFDEAGVVHVAGEGESLGAGALLSAERAVPLQTVIDDEGDVCKGLHVIEDGGRLPQTLFDGSGGLDAGHTALTLNGGGEGAALAADESAGAGIDMDAEVEAASKDIITQQTHFLGLGNGGLETADGQRILGTDVDVSVLSAGGAACDHHALEDAVGVTLHDGAVHKGAGVTLVTVADHVLHGSLLLPCAVPLAACGETAAAAATEAGVGDELADVLIGHLKESLFKGGVAVLGDVLFDIFGIGSAAVGKHHTVLLLIEGDILLTGIGNAVQRIHKAVNELAAQDGLFHDLVAVLGLNVDVHPAHGLNVDQGTHFTEAVAAAHLDMEALLLVIVMLEANIHGDIALFALFLNVLIDLQRAAGDTAGTGADENGSNLLACFQRPLCLQAVSVEAVSCELAHALASFARISLMRATALSGVILEWTSPSMVITGARPQAPRQATVSSVNRPSSEVWRRPERPSSL